VDNVEAAAGRSLAMSEFETLRIDRPAGREYVARLVIDRPDQLNTITRTVLAELPTALSRLEADEAVRAVVLEGAGDRVFSAGADVQAFADSGSHLEGRDRSREGQESFARLEESPLPIVAAIDGVAVGGGMELAACADLRIASEVPNLASQRWNSGSFLVGVAHSASRGSSARAVRKKLCSPATGTTRPS
jgi:Enoyl-CoA hydratase/carnithine racemase